MVDALNERAHILVLHGDVGGGVGHRHRAESAVGKSAVHRWHRSSGVVLNDEISADDVQKVHRASPVFGKRASFFR